MRLRSPGPAAAGPPAPPGPRPTGGAGIALLAVTLAWGALFAPQLFGSRIFVAGDVATYRPYAEFSSGRWRTLHRRTFWNPYVFAGIPATASLADGRPQYLPDPLLDAYERLMHARLWPPLGLPLIAHLLGMLAAAGLARALWGGGTAAMAWAGLAWGLTPN